jgi:hypothetical protein
MIFQGCFLPSFDSFGKAAHLVPIRLQTWPPQTILVSDWLSSKKYSMKPLFQMNRNLVGSIYGRSSILIVHFDSIREQPYSYAISKRYIDKDSIPFYFLEIEEPFKELQHF